MAEDDQLARVMKLVGTHPADPDLVAKRLSHLRQLGVTRGWVIEVELFDGSVRRGPVYGTNDDWLMVMGAPIMDPDVVIDLWKV